MSESKSAKAVRDVVENFHMTDMPLETMAYQCFIAQLSNPEVAPEVISHNMETVKRLTREVRIQAKYERSLEVLRYLKEAGQNRTKTGIMLGLGETKDEVFQTIEDVRNANVDIITIGQYLQPTKNHLPVKRFVELEEFEEYRIFAENLGFRHVESSPLVRSSYHAEKHIH